MTEQHALIKTLFCMKYSSAKWFTLFLSQGARTGDMAGTPELHHSPLDWRRHWSATATA